MSPDQLLHCIANTVSSIVHVSIDVPHIHTACVYCTVKSYVHLSFTILAFAYACSNNTMPPWQYSLPIRVQVHTGQDYRRIKACGTGATCMVLHCGTILCIYACMRSASVTKLRRAT